MCHYFFDLTHFRGQKKVHFFEDLKTPKFYSEINRPLGFTFIFWTGAKWLTLTYLNNFRI